MAALTLSWVPRNAALQADVPVDHFAAAVAAPAGWQVVVEWRYRADAGDDWGAPTTQIITPPVLHADYDPPAAGWVQVTSYSIQGGRVSRGIVREFEVDGDGLAEPAPYVDESNEAYEDETGVIYYDKD